MCSIIYKNMIANVILICVYLKIVDIWTSGYKMLCIARNGCIWYLNIWTWIWRNIWIHVQSLQRIHVWLKWVIILSIEVIISYAQKFNYPFKLQPLVFSCLIEICVNTWNHNITGVLNKSLLFCTVVYIVHKNS